MSRILGFVIPPVLSLLIQALRLLTLWDRQRPRGFGPSSARWRRHNNPKSGNSERSERESKGLSKHVPGSP